MAARGRRRMPPKGPHKRTQQYRLVCFFGELSHAFEGLSDAAIVRLVRSGMTNPFDLSEAVAVLTPAEARGFLKRLTANGHVTIRTVW